MTKLNEIIGVYKYQDKATAPNTDDITFTGPAVPKDQVLELTHGSVIDVTTANKALSIGIKKPDGTIHYVRYEKAANDNEAHVPGKLYLTPGEAPVAVVGSPTAANVCYCTFHGLLYKYP